MLPLFMSLRRRSEKDNSCSACLSMNGFAATAGNNSVVAKCSSSVRKGGRTVEAFRGIAAPVEKVEI